METRAQAKEMSWEVEAVLAELQEDQPTTTKLKVSREPREVEQTEIDKGVQVESESRELVKEVGESEVWR